MQRRVQRALQLFRELGFAGFLPRLGERVRRATAWTHPEAGAYIDGKARSDAAFDAAHAVDTGGIEHLIDLSIEGPNARHGHSHIASDPEEFAAVFAAAGVDVASRTFVDLGSGKGRALLLAVRLGFDRVVGVEFARELHETAVANIGRLPADEQARVTAVLGDAAAFDYPEDPLVVFLYNPFGPKIVARVAERLLASWRRHPRPVTVVYVRPLFKEGWTAAGWREAAGGEGFCVLAPGGPA